MVRRHARKLVAAAAALAVAGGIVALVIVLTAPGAPTPQLPRSGILVDGGAGTDKYDTEGDGTLKLRSVEVLHDTLENPFI